MDVDSFDWTKPACLFRTDLVSGLLAVIIDFSLTISLLILIVKN